MVTKYYYLRDKTTRYIYYIPCQRSEDVLTPGEAKYEGKNILGHSFDKSSTKKRSISQIINVSKCPQSCFVSFCFVFALEVGRDHPKDTKLK